VWNAGFGKLFYSLFSLSPCLTLALAFLVELQDSNLETLQALSSNNGSSSSSITSSITSSSSHPFPREPFLSRPAALSMRLLSSLRSTHSERRAQCLQLETALILSPTLISAPQSRPSKGCTACRSGVPSYHSGSEPSSLIYLVCGPGGAIVVPLNGRTLVFSRLAQVCGGLDLEAGRSRGARDASVGPEHRDHQPVL
jgi:hypothetical protein